jgi:polygalacturonase
LGIAGCLLLAALPACAERTCDVQRYGAKGDGSTKDTVAIQKAIDECASHGGGTVKVAGAKMFVSAPLVLKSNITLAVAAGTTLAASTDYADFPDQQEFRDLGRQAFITARNAENIVISGGGVIDGRGEAWWSHREKGFRRPRLIVFDHSKHIRMENITVQNSPMWQIVPYYSDDLIFRNMKILAPARAGHNTDGIDPFSSSNVLIEHVLIDMAMTMSPSRAVSPARQAAMRPAITSPYGIANSSTGTAFPSAAKSPAACTMYWRNGSISRTRIRESG